MTLAFTPPASLDHEEIARRIPHQGSMCLLDRVSAWDSERISCEATSHLDPGNPLRAHGRLGAACGIEYAAQAMAVHGALVAEMQAAAPDEAPKAGYLVSVRGVSLHVARLDDLGTAMAVRAERRSGNAGSVLYDFTVHAGDALLLSGRAVVMLDAAMAPTNPKETP
ncbi:hotdog family protein [Polaromonas sp. CT11-55]|uniref:hotdog family protein n=1 Tax=Polaromonas sp. CT11-55 TaxID=3243045 RepID=UPI0039A5915F